MLCLSLWWVLAGVAHAGIWLWVPVTVQQCGQWSHPYGTDGKGPFTVHIRDADTNAILETWPNTAPTANDAWTWQCDLPAGAKITYEFLDSSGQQAQGYARTVEGSTEAGCLGRNAGLTSDFHRLYDAQIALLQATKTSATSIASTSPPDVAPLATTSTASPTPTSTASAPASLTSPVSTAPTTSSTPTTTSDEETAAKSSDSDLVLSTSGFATVSRRPQVTRTADDTRSVAVAAVDRSPASSVSASSSQRGAQSHSATPEKPTNADASPHNTLAKSTSVSQSSGVSNDSADPTQQSAESALADGSHETTKGTSTSVIGAAVAAVLASFLVLGLAVLWCKRSRKAEHVWPSPTNSYIEKSRQSPLPYQGPIYQEPDYHRDDANVEYYETDVQTTTVGQTPSAATPSSPGYLTESDRPKGPAVSPQTSSGSGRNLAAPDKLPPSAASYHSPTNPCPSSFRARSTRRGQESILSGSTGITNKSKRGPDGTKFSRFWRNTRISRVTVPDPFERKPMPEEHDIDDIVTTYSDSSPRHSEPVTNFTWLDGGVEKREKGAPSTIFPEDMPY